MDSSQSFKQISGDFYSSGKSMMSQPSSEPPVYQDNPAGYPSSFPSQSVLQGSYTQDQYPGQSVVFVPTAPLTNPVPEHICYSIFTLMCCCFSLGTAALVYSLSTRHANYSGQRELAERNSKTARNLNHIALALGMLCILGYVLYLLVLMIKI